MLHKKLVAVVGAAALMTVLAGAPAYATNDGPTLSGPGTAPVLGGAGDGVTHLVINPGYLEFDPVDVSGNGGAVSKWTMPDFSSITLGGTPELTGVRIPPFAVIDARGAALGWHINVTIADLVHTNAGANVLGNGPTYTIPATTMSMTRPWVIDQSQDPTVAPDITTRTNNANVVPNDIPSFNGAQEIVTADPANPAPAASTNPTEGTFLISPMPVRVLVPSDASVGTYDSLVTVDLVSAP